MAYTNGYDLEKALIGIDGQQKSLNLFEIDLGWVQLDEFFINFVLT